MAGNEVHLQPACFGQEIPGQQIDPTGAHLFLGSRPRPAVNHFDIQPQLLAQVLEQVSIGTDQLLGVLRVAPQVRRVFRIAGRGEPSACIIRYRSQGQRQQAQQ